MGEATQVSEERISQAEMVEMFGEAMPVEAVNLVWNSPPGTTCGELRRKLREIAAARTPDLSTDDIVERLRFRPQIISGGIVVAESDYANPDGPAAADLIEALKERVRVLEEESPITYRSSISPPTEQT